MLHQQVYHLREQQQIFKEILSTGGWKEIPMPEVELSPGISHPVVRALKERLKAEHYLISSATTDVFDSLTITTLAAWQRNHGLPDTGLPDAETLTSLNIPARDRLKQIETNITRWERIPRDTGQQYIMVNIPDYRLEVFYQGLQKLTMRVIVGRPQRKTPEFHATMTSIIFNPSWRVPATIFYEDLLPEIRRDPTYLARHHMSLFQTNSNGTTKEVSPDTIEWSAVSTDSHFFLVQAPGPDNALGAVKFLFPNPHNVYIHDTPTKKLFSAPYPAFSSGCIRASDAMGLARYLLNHQAAWNSASIMETIASGKTEVALLETPVEVYITYTTAWVDDSGGLQFRKDIYHKD